MAPLRAPTFELTKREKVMFREDVESLLRQCERILADNRHELSVVDYAEAFRLVRDAILLANDRDACEFAPLARCNLYKGHILRGLQKLPEARDAYLAAAKAKTSDSLDTISSRTASRLVSVMDKKILEKKRAAGIWEVCGEGKFRCLDGLCFHNDGRDPRLKKVGLDTEVWDPEPASMIRIRVVGRKTGR